MARHDPPNNPPEPVSNESGDVSPKVLFERAQLHDRPGVLEGKEEERKRNKSKRKKKVILRSEEPTIAMASKL